MMVFNKVMKEKRKELGLTQEQVAEYMGVSTPAVSKWETGQTFPDITLLPILARLFKIDLNTLFNFQAKMTPNDINQFSLKVLELIENESLESAFEQVETKVKEFPSDEVFIIKITTLLEGTLISKDYEAHEKEKYFKKINIFLSSIENSEEPTIRFSARLAKIRMLIRAKKWNEAQELLDKTDSIILDKKSTELQLALAKKDFLEANKLIEKTILNDASHLYNALLTKLQLSVELNNFKEIEYYCYLAKQTSKMFDLAPMLSILAELIQSIYKNEINPTLDLLEKLQEEQLQIWTASDSPLYKHIESKSVDTRNLFPSKSFEALFAPLDLSFIQAEPRYTELNELWKSRKPSL